MSEKITIKIEVDNQGLIEISVALAQAIALMEESSSETVVTYYTTKNTLRSLLGDIHAQCALPDANNYGEKTSYRKGKQILF